MATPQELIGQREIKTGKYFDPDTGNIVPTPASSSTSPQSQTSISSATLANNPTPQFQSALPINPPSISGIDTTIQNTASTLSAPEQNVSDLTKRITDLNNSLLGKTAYTQQQEASAGLPEFQKAQNDLAAQIKGYQIESQNLQNIAANVIPAQLQEQAAGRGITAGGLAPLQASELRKNQIQQGIIASKALTASAAFEALKGNIANAQLQIDRAVVAKYGPQEEANKVALANLEILLKDPSITLAEKNRANAQALILKQKEVELTKAKQDQTDIWKTSTDAAQNVTNFKPTGQYPTSASALQAIQGAPTKEKALQIATETGLTKPPVAQSDFEQAFLREKGRLPTVDELTAHKAALAAAGRNPNPPTTIQERTAQAVSNFSNAFVPGAKHNGIDVIGPDGFIDPRAWKAAIKDAPAEGLTRAQFIKEFGHLVNLQDAKSYGLTPIELKLVTPPQ